MDIEQVRLACLRLKDVTEDMPFGDDIITFRIQGKIFLGLWLGGHEHVQGNAEPRFALKLSPDRNIELRERYIHITPAWHWNKTHWSDVYYEKFDNEFICELIRESYLLVVSKLPRKIREQYH